MSKLKINKKIKKFFRKNKLKIVSLTMSCSLTMNVVYATMNIQTKTNTKQLKPQLFQLIQNTDNDNIIKPEFKVYKKSKK